MRSVVISCFSKGDALNETVMWLEFVEISPWPRSKRDGDAARVRCLEEVEAPEQRGLAAAGGADYTERLPLLKGEADVVEDLGLVKVLFKVFDFQYRHFSAPLPEELELALQGAEQEGDDAVEDEVVYTREEQRPDETGVAVRALEEGVAGPDDLLVGDNARE